MTATEQLDRLAAEFAECARRGHELADRLDEQAWRARPPAGGWSVAECLAHLTLTTDAMAPLIVEGLEQAQRLAVAPPARLRADLMGRLLAWLLEPPSRVKTKTPPAFVPVADLPKADGLAAWDRAHATLADLVARARGAPIDRVKIVSPFDPRGKLKYSVYSALLILAAHERRHLWQASRALA